jgi:hypothetical protein
MLSLRKISINFKNITNEKFSKELI